MAGETIKAKAICLDIRPWSRTSHVVSWLTPNGRISTVVKGAVRPKSAFLGQYDLNYTCEVIYYARAHGDLHALRECVPLALRDRLRTDYRALALAGYCRSLVERLAPEGPDCAEWFALLEETLDAIPPATPAHLLRFELATLRLLGLEPGVEAETGAFSLRGERRIPISAAVADLIRRGGEGETNEQVALDAVRAIGVYYENHVDCVSDVRRVVLRIIQRNRGKEDEH